MLHDLAYPLTFTFRRLALAPQFSVVDRDGRQVAFIKQRLFKLRESVKVYRDDSQRELLYRIEANRWLDFSASYRFTRADGTPEGRVARQGARSLWKAHYEVYDAQDRGKFSIRERSVTTRVLDGMLGQIPVVGLLTGFFFHPSYDVRRTGGDGEVVATFTKRSSATGRRFGLERVGAIDPADEPEVVLALMMLVLLEKERG